VAAWADRGFSVIATESASAKPKTRAIERDDENIIHPK